MTRFRQVQSFAKGIGLTAAWGQTADACAIYQFYQKAKRSVKNGVKVNDIRKTRTAGCIRNGTFGCFFTKIGNFGPYQVKTLRGNALRRNRIMRGVIMRKTDGEGVRIGTCGDSVCCVDDNGHSPVENHRKKAYNR